MKRFALLFALLATLIVAAPTNAATSNSLTIVGATSGNVTGGVQATGQIRLAKAATESKTFELSNTNTTAATVPESVVLASGSTTATFAIKTKTVDAAKSVKVTAVTDGLTLTATFSVVPAKLSSVIFPASVISGKPAAGVIQLTGVTKSDLTVAITLSTELASAPEAVTVPAGKSSAKFNVTTSPDLETYSVVVSAVAAGVTKTDTISAKGITISSLTLAKSSATAGGKIKATVTLNGPAPVDMYITFSTTNAAVATISRTGSIVLDTVQGDSGAMFRIAEGKTTVSTNVVTNGDLEATATVTIRASDGSTTKTKTLTVKVV